MSEQSKNAFEVKWRVENVKSWFRTRDDCIYSPQFLIETLANTRWKLRLARQLHLEEKYISLALERDLEDDYLKPIDLNYELSFLACDESPLKSKSCKTKFAPKTASVDLNVKEVEILQEKKDVFLPEGILTVSCKLWKAWSTSKGGQCSVHSVIGKKCITLDGALEYFSKLYDSKVPLNFTSPSSEISFISFEVRRDGSGLSVWFERAKVKSKCLNFYSCKLYFLKANGEKTGLRESTALESLLISNKSGPFRSLFDYYTLQNWVENDTLKLQLDITYYPGVESERIEYDISIDKKMTVQNASLDNVNASDIEKIPSQPLNYLHLSEDEDKACHESSDEEECTGAEGKRHLPSTTLKDDLASLYEDRLFCDTKLRTDTETFPAHRSVLSARSPVFKKMFTTDMKEKAGECINVPDISSNTVKRMLRFLYTDCTGDLEMQTAKDLYVASDKYDIASLKQRCTSFMKKNLCPANVCEILVLADMHQDKNLEFAAQEYVLDNDEEVFYSDEWKLFMKNYSGLAAQVMYLKFTKK